MFRSWLFAGILIACLSGCGGSVPSASDNSALAADRSLCNVRAINLRGLWDVFSLGLNELTDRMNAASIPAEARSGPDWPHIVQEILSNDEIPLVLVGHSYGADQAILICEELAARGRSVALLVLIDPTDPGTIPANVDRCVQFYIPTALGSDYPDIFAGSPAAASDGNTHTTFRNILVSIDTLGVDVTDTDHFNLESNDLVHAIIIDEVRQLCASGAVAP
ncbi:MAG: hypothetical protein JNG88_01825 [Phycisphaerales bacterium]|nr:hypothetical protein [Phycisphaerales bacterium]